MAEAGGRNKTNSNQTSKTPTPISEMADGGGVEKIRDILFGNQIKDIQKKDLYNAEEKFLELASGLRQLIFDKSKTLSTDIRQKNHQTSASLSAAAIGLEEAKIDRTTSAQYLIQMAMRISDRERVPVEKN
jgi:hypothetical protein